nr:unnamed protein product [Callosobruchus analis]
MILPLLAKNVKELAETTVPTELLFGDELGDRIKSAKMAETTGKSIKATYTAPHKSPYPKTGGGAGKRPHSQYIPENRYRPTRRAANRALLTKTRGGGEDQTDSQEVVEVRYAGRLKRYYENWNRLTTNKVVLNWVKGYQIPFVRPPLQRVEPRIKLSPKEITDNVHTALQLLQSLGFLINLKKSSLIPNKSCKFLGLVFNSTQMSVQLTPEKKLRILKWTRHFLKKRTFKIRLFAKLLGLLVAACPGSTCKYGTINTHRSAISLILTGNVGSDPTVCRFLKGVSKLRPAQPKYAFTWDPHQVLTYLESLDEMLDNSLKTLSYKLVTLIALVTGQRLQTLYSIKVSDIVESSSGLQIFITDYLKTSGTGRQQPCLHLPFFKDNVKLCAASTLKRYLAYTNQLRKFETEYCL